MLVGRNEPEGISLTGDPYGRGRGRGPGRRSRTIIVTLPHDISASFYGSGVILSRVVCRHGCSMWNVEGMGSATKPPGFRTQFTPRGLTLVGSILVMGGVRLLDNAVPFKADEQRSPVLFSLDWVPPQQVHTCHPCSRAAWIAPARTPGLGDAYDPIGIRHAPCRGVVSGPYYKAGRRTSGFFRPV